MIVTDLLLGLLIGVGFAFALFMVWRKRQENDTMVKSMENKLAEVFPEVLKQAQEQMIMMAKENLGAEKAEIKTDLENKRAAIEKMIDQVQTDLKDRDKTSQAILQQMKDHQELTKDLQVTTEGLKKVLTNNQLRGQFGEQVAEDLLRMSGFVKGVDFEFNKSQNSSSTRPDFCIYLPDRTKINVDVKFPYQSLQKATETDDKQAKVTLMKQFEADVKEKIKQVTTREYINPEDKTVDFVILFVPNEMIFSYIYDKMGSIWKEAMQKKVIFAGPFSFTAILRMVRQAYDNFHYQENIQEIITHIKRFDIEFEKYNLEFDKIGDRISSLNSQYELVSSTRTRQLQKTVEKIKLESGKDSDKQVDLLP